MLYVAAFSHFIKKFEKFDFPFSLKEDLLPDDQTTLFICSGMQQYKQKFLSPDYTRLSTLQNCIRTDDLELIGDGSHLTFFQMLGNFSFGNNDYKTSVLLWHELVKELKIPVTHVTVHPNRKDHLQLWEDLKYQIIFDTNCQWSDGNIGGYCCEMYVGNLEIGNLVNTLDHSTDVGFGWERLIQILEQKNRVDETSLFDQTLSYISRDHVRTLNLLWQNKITPGGKGRNFICRRLLRRLLLESNTQSFLFQDWLDQERQLKEKNLKLVKRVYKKYKQQSIQWWYETYGILPEELENLTF